jgi:Uri superfamily endonuclease
LHNNKCELICWFISQEINEELKRRVEAAAKIISNGGTDETNSERLNSSFNKNNSMSTASIYHQPRDFRQCGVVWTCGAVRSDQERRIERSLAHGGQTRWHYLVYSACEDEC